MKKLLVSITAILFALQVSIAQTEKGTQNLGVNFQFNYNKFNDFMINPGDNSTSTLVAKTTIFSIGPNYSYFIADKLDVGINFSFGTSNFTNATENIGSTNDYYPLKENSYSYGGNIFVRKYYMYKNKIGFRTGAYVGYSYGYSNSTYTLSYSANNYKNINNNYFGGVNLDMVYYASKKLGVSATLANLRYDHNKFDSGNRGHGTGDSVNFAFINNGLSLSVFYVIGK